MTIEIQELGNSRKIIFPNEGWSKGPKCTRVPGTENLFTSSVLPEGLLCKDVPSLTHCVDSGGMLLVDPDSARWMLLVGKTLVSALAAKKLGKVLTPFVSDAVFSPNIMDTAAGKRTYVSGKTSKSVLPGGELVRPFVEVDYFDGSRDLHAFAVVTAATAGMGTSHTTAIPSTSTEKKLGTGPGRTVLQVLIPSSVSFVTMLRQTFIPFYLANTDGKIRAYYEQSIDSVLASIDPHLKPTLGVVETWDSLGASAGVTFRSRRVSGPYGDALTKLGFSSEVMKKVVGTEASAWSPALSWVEAGDLKTETWGTNFFTVATKVGLMRGGLLVLMDDVAEHRASYQLPSGVIDGLNTSVIRDSMCLARSLVSGTGVPREANYPSLGHYLAAAFDQYGVVKSVDAGSFDETTGPTRAAAAMSDHQIPLEDTENIFLPGSLAMHLERFSRAWDAAAFAKV